MPPIPSIGSPMAYLSDWSSQPGSFPAVALYIERRFNTGPSPAPGLVMQHDNVISEQARPLTPQRPTDTPLEMPTVSRAMTFLSRVFRLRCPHCGNGAVLLWNGGVRERCSGCQLRFQRGDSNYFFGAMF